MVSYAWRPKVQWLNHQMNVSDVFMLSWAAKWDGATFVKSAYLTPTEVKNQDDKFIVADLANLIREADIIVAHNGDRFDLPKINGRVALLGLEPLGPVDTIDTLKLSRQSFGFGYHNLDFLAKEFLGESKIETNWSWWEDILNGDPKAMKKMVRYNKKDVVLLERVFHAMMPYVKNLRRLYEGSGDLSCPYCGSTDRQNRGKKRNKTTTYQQHQCNGCLRYYHTNLINKELAKGN